MENFSHEKLNETMDWLLRICMWYQIQIQWEMRVRRSLELPSKKINLMDLPLEIILMILEKLIGLDPITLLGSVPCVCRRIRKMCSVVRGEFDLRNKWKFREFALDNWTGLQGALASVGRMFPRTRGLWTFSKWPLHDACETGLTATTDALLKEDESKVNFEAGRWNVTEDLLVCRYVTPLHLACEKGHAAVVRLLVEKGADVDKARNDGRTPFYMACQEGHLDVVQLLLEKGADMDKAKDSGATPLYIARYQGHAEIISILEQAGANE